MNHPHQCVSDHSRGDIDVRFPGGSKPGEDRHLLWPDPGRHRKRKWLMQLVGLLGALIVLGHFPLRLSLSLLAPFGSVAIRTSRSRILLVGEPDGATEAVADALAQEGHEILRTADPHEAVLTLIYDANAFDVVALNLDTGVLLWDEFFRKLRFATDPGVGRPWPKLLCWSTTHLGHDLELRLLPDGVMVLHEVTPRRVVERVRFLILAHHADVSARVSLVITHLQMGQPTDCRPGETIVGCQLQTRDLLVEVPLSTGLLLLLDYLARCRFSKSARHIAIEMKSDPFIRWHVADRGTIGSLRPKLSVHAVKMGISRIRKGIAEALSEAGLAASATSILQSVDSGHGVNYRLRAQVQIVHIGPARGYRNCLNRHSPGAVPSLGPTQHTNNAHSAPCKGSHLAYIASTRHS